MLCVGVTACSSSPTPPSPFPRFALIAGPTTEAFEYHLAPDDAVHVEWQEAYHRWAVQALDVTVSRRIRFNKYHDRSHMHAVIGIGGTNAFANAESFDIHTIWPRDNHEVVHLYSSSFGRPVALWSEGLAVAYQTNPAAGDLVPHWSGVALDDLARRLQSEGRLFPIANLLTTADFRQFDESITYPESGSFMRFVLATCGLDGVKRFFATGASTDSRESVAAQFHAACGGSITTVERSWLAQLQSR